MHRRGYEIQEELQRSSQRHHASVNRQVRTRVRHELQQTLQISCQAVHVILSLAASHGAVALGSRSSMMHRPQ